MKRGVALSVLISRILVIGLIILGCVLAFRWGERARRSALQKLSSMSTEETELVGTERPVDGDENRRWIEVVSWSPRVFVYHNFISQEDCDHIVEMGKNYVTRSEVVGTTGKAVQHEARSSSGTAIMGEMAKDPAVKRVQKQIADWTQIPESHGEWFYLIRYEEGQQYKPHNDYFSDDANGQPFIGNWGNRFATVLTYLSTPDEGGETVFPKSDLKVKAKKGDAVLFFNMFPDVLLISRALPTLCHYMVVYL